MGKKNIENENNEKIAQAKNKKRRKEKLRKTKEKSRRKSSAPVKTKIKKRTLFI